MSWKNIFELLGGLGLFIFGMKTMGDGLQKAAGNRLKKILETLTRNRVFAILVGAFVTAIIQSSSATTVMTVGFVNAGLMDLFQAAGVIMGANIGTTMTAQLIAFKLTDIAPLVLAIGTIMVMFGKRKRTKDLGGIILGFGMLFVGMKIMEKSMRPLTELDEFKNLITTIGQHPIMGVFVGLGMTAVVQSSSATIGILQALAGLNAMPLAVALPILFGDNIGTCVTALLASIGTSKNAKRAALIHLTFNIIGTIIFMLILPVVVKLIPVLGGDIKRQIANAHTMFNITNTLIQAPFIVFLVKFVNWLIPGKEDKEDVMTLEHLDRRLLETPSIAVGQLVKEVIRMGRLASKNLSTAIDAIINEDENAIKQVFNTEEVINFLEREITGFMVALSNTSLSEEQSELVSGLFHVVNDIERVGDHADNLAELAQYKIDNKLPFSESAISQLTKMYETVKFAIDSSIEALENTDFIKAEDVIETEGKIDELEKRFREDHIDRLSRGICNPVSGTVFLDILSNLERIGDHANNIAQMVLDQKEELYA
ncbi:Na/Pi cotransporter family protein [Caloramator sp. CAR-1]|uniref:Na/Pi cotransporter family protein n=1 Tax=Caloramator sp. CAR-1 TaxID=3062777 RepID=UPI0026E36AE0|nr:Na/Pi cotransporter family protein [Caloramator sp. CAR-1]MDO6353947.1 Na/Pi cotransporter family protein [Caloramator sp. CAR-1]